MIQNVCVNKKHLLDGDLCWFKNKTDKNKWFKLLYNSFEAAI